MRVRVGESGRACEECERSGRVSECEYECACE